MSHLCCVSDSPYVPNLCVARTLALAASSSRFFGGAVVSSERRRRFATPAISSTAFKNAGSLAFDGLPKPLIFLTNCSDAARTSSSVTGGSKLNRILIFLHISRPHDCPTQAKYRLEWATPKHQRAILGILMQLTCVPDVPGREPVVSLAPGSLGVRLVVDVHIEVVAEGEAETIGKDVAIARDVGREHGLTRPTGAAIY